MYQQFAPIGVYVNKTKQQQQQQQQQQQNTNNNNTVTVWFGIYDTQSEDSKE